MAGNRLTLSDLREETWEHQLTRVTEETRDLIVATRKVIAETRVALARADDILRQRR